MTYESKKTEWMVHSRIVKAANEGWICELQREFKILLEGLQIWSADCSSALRRAAKMERMQARLV